MIKDLTGQEFGRLTVIEDTGKRNKGKSVIWLCRCDCGKFTEVDGSNLRKGATKSCGCWRREESARQHYKHGGKGTKLYNIWRSMKARCYYLRNNKYKYYGGRGIEICDEWKADFIPFRDFALAHGYREGLSIDRRDNDGDYEPSNVQFLTLSENTSKARRLKK